MGAAVASLTLTHAKVYSSASTQMIVDAPRTALGNAEKDLTPFTARAFVFARLMTTPDALQYIGQAAGVPGNLISASGPTELTGPQATHAPTAVQGIRLTSPSAHYKLNFLQNPELPTVDVYAEAPTTKRAIALANGAVAGFSAYLAQLDNQSSVPVSQRIAIRQVGSATGGVVDPGASKSLAAVIFVAVLALWCGLLLYAQSLVAQLRLARAEQRLPQTASASIGAAPLATGAPRLDSALAALDFEEQSNGHGGESSLTSTWPPNRRGRGRETTHARPAPDFEERANGHGGDSPSRTTPSSTGVEDRKESRRLPWGRQDL